jgi:hypothetical protein
VEWSWLCMKDCIAIRLPEPSSDKDDMMCHQCQCSVEQKIPRIQLVLAEANLWVPL